MSYTAERTTVGFERVYNLAGHAPNPVPYELKPNTEFKKGELVVVDGGFVEQADDNTDVDDCVLGVMAEAIAQADNPSDEKTYGRVYINPLDVFRVSVGDPLELTATGGSTTTLEASSINDIEGSTILVYTGKSKGSIRTIDDVTTNTARVYVPFPHAIESGDKAVVIANNNNDGEIWPGLDGLFASSDALKLKCDKNHNNGPLKIVKIDVVNLMVDVLIAR